MTSLLGRDVELARLSVAVRDPAAVALVVLEGEAGIGKTALAEEIAHSVEATRSVRWARGIEDAGAPPFWLWQQALGRPVSTGQATDADRFVLFEDLRLALTADGPTLLVVDDVHWADEPSLRALLHVIRHTRQGLQICLTARVHQAGPGWLAVGPELLAEPATLRLPVRGLDLDAATACLAAASKQLVDADLAVHAWRESQGNPLFLRELGRNWQDGAGAMSVPATLAALVQRRVAVLAPETQELLSAASVLGDDLEIAVAAQLLDRPAAACLPAVDEVQRAGLLVGSGVGRVRFSHGLVRRAIEERLGLPMRLRLHRRAAEALEALHGEDLSRYLSDLARHWSQCALGEDRRVAASWARRAADAAAQSLAYEEAARLYQLAVSCGGSVLTSAERGPLLLGQAVNQITVGRLEEARIAAREAAALDLPELLADLALALEPIGDRAWDRDVHDRCRRALAVPDLASSVRARLLARLTETAMYLGQWAEALDTSADALAQANDLTSEVAALRARQLALSGPEHRQERRGLVKRMTTLGAAHDRPRDEMWGVLWGIDLAYEEGRLPDVAGEVSRLTLCVDRVGSPLARWHLDVARAALAQARADFTAAREYGEAGFRAMAALGHPAAFGAFMSLLGACGHHVGYDPMSFGPPEQGAAEGEVRGQIFASIGPALALAESGRTAEAEVRYRRPGPPWSWDIPPYFTKVALGCGLLTADALGIIEDVAWYREQLQAHRGTHIAGSAGSASYFGPCELLLGLAAAALGDHAQAEADLTAATQVCRRIGAVGFATEADIRRAELLSRTGRHPAAMALATGAMAEANRLGMAPWATRAAGLLTPSTDPLTPRERDVAALVARGLSNKEIAAEFVISARTAENHVQHILAKLGLASRAQVAPHMSTRTSTSTDVTSDRHT